MYFVILKQTELLMSIIILLLSEIYIRNPTSHLVIPKRHIVTYFQCNENEHIEIPRILNSQKNKLIDSDREITGFNIGMNIGEDAGQTVFHFHIHIIPRRTGDAENPRGGIRGGYTPSPKLTLLIELFLTCIGWFHD